MARSRTARPSDIGELALALPETAQAIAERLGLTDPLIVQYGRWIKGVFLGTEYDIGAGVEHCPAPCLGCLVMKE